MNPKRSHDPLIVSAAYVVLTASFALLTPACDEAPSRSKPPAEASWTPALKEQVTELEATLRPREEDAGGALRVQLAFPGEADLDLYVTGPLLETVYYANTPTRTGGSLTQDRRCTHPPPRLETVSFARPPAGRYRIGVDYARRCEEDAEVVAFVVAVDSAGGRELRRGLAVPAVFEPIVLEVDVASASPPSVERMSEIESGQAERPDPSPKP